MVTHLLSLWTRGGRQTSGPIGQRLVPVEGCLVSSDGNTRMKVAGTAAVLGLMMLLFLVAASSGHQRCM